MSSGKQPAGDDQPTGQNSPDEQTGLEEAIWQLSVGSGSTPYPQRFNVPDCIYYLRFGVCDYGARCRFSHPRNRSLAMQARRAAGEYPQREGQHVCQYYMRTGMCKFGASCKYHHPRQRGESTSLVMPNIHGYPLRPNERECSHYMKTGQCKFGMTCKFHHPQPADAQVPASAVAPLPLPEAVLPPTTYPAMQSPFVDSAELHGMIAGNWPVVRPTLLPGSYFPGTYSPMLFPPGMVPMPDWTPYPDSTSPVPSQTTQSAAGPNPVYRRTQLSASAPAYTGPHISVITSIGASSSTRNESAFPQRPGQPECHYYMKYGDCKFGSSCKYHHPAEWNETNADLVNAMGLPHDLSLHLSILFLPCHNNLHSEGARKNSISIILLALVCSFSYQFTASISTTTTTTTTLYPVKSHKWDFGRVNVRRPYHYLIEIERLFPKDPHLNYLINGCGSKKSCCRRIPQERGSICLPGMCKFGASCKYHHPRQRGESTSLVMPNIHGYPLRPNEKECSHYMKAGQCKFGMTCKFHHHQPVDAQVPASAAAPLPLPEVVLPPTTYPAVQSPSVDSAEQYEMIAGNWSVVRPTLLPGSYFPGTYGPMLFPPGMVPMPDWTPYPDSTSPVPSQTTQSAAGPNPVYRRTQLSTSVPAYTGPHMSVIASIDASSSTQNESTFPQRPGQPECHYYMKYGIANLDLHVSIIIQLSGVEQKQILSLVLWIFLLTCLCIYPFSFFHVPTIFIQRGRESIQ